MDTYNVGAGSNPIKFSADITTFGLARSRAIVVNPDSTAGATLVSTDASGDIPRSILDIASNLSGKKLMVLTEISLAVIPSLDDRKAEYGKIVFECTLEGGTDVLKKYPAPDNKTVNTDYTKVMLVKEIALA